MEKNNYLKKFQTTEEYNTFKASSDYVKPNVSWIVNENKSMTEPYVKPLTSGIVIHKNGIFKEVSYNDFDTHYDDIVAGGYTIEGVIAVPSTHTPDGTTRIMSLKFMSTGTPETGISTSGNTMCWGGYGLDLTGLTNYTDVANVTNVSGETTISPISYGYVPSDAFTEGTGAQSVVDERAKYYSGTTSSYYCPSPYLTGDEPNPLYRMTTVTNGLSDMDGSGNTEIIIANATAQPNWRTDATITNSSSTGYYPAACCCKRYGTSGIPSGSWYLPALGELGYVAARLGTINSLLTLIATKDPSIGAAVLPSNDVWSSSESSSGYARRVKFRDGRVDTYGKANSCRVRAFASVHAIPLTF